MIDSGYLIVVLSQITEDYFNYNRCPLVISYLRRGRVVRNLLMCVMVS